MDKTRLRNRMIDINAKIYGYMYNMYRSTHMDQGILKGEVSLYH
jgi:hypothetical protein